LLSPRHSYHVKLQTLLGDGPALSPGHSAACRSGQSSNGCPAHRMIS
jgi:hypothetical protein